MHRQVLLLATAQALFQTVSTMVITIGALAGRAIAPFPELATAPIAAMFLGTVVATIPASIWMARVGRRIGFVTGALIGALGGLVAASGLLLQSLLLLSLGTLLIGVYQGFAQFYRFAASEVSDDAFRPRAISLVLAGGIVAAVLGPALGAFGLGLLNPDYLGSFLMLAAAALIGAAVLLRLRVPAPGIATGKDGGRPLLAIVRQPIFAVALFAAATASGVMVLAMTATPLAMAHGDHRLSDTTIVIQLHVLGMFLPSFFTGSLISRFGVFRVMIAGTALMTGHVGLSLSGTGFASFASALILLGAGWNFLYIGGTTLLTKAYRPAEKARAQAANDMLVFVVGLAAAMSAGVLLEAAGWQLLNAILLPWLLIAAAAIWWLGRGPTRHA
jgi:MFS family permease